MGWKHVKDETLNERATYRLINDWDERLQHFGYIEFDIRHPAIHVMSIGSKEDTQK